MGGMVAPKRYVHILTPRTWKCDLIWKKGFADVIIDPEVRSSQIRQVGPKSKDKCPPDRR